MFATVRQLFGSPQPDGAAPELQAEALAAGRSMAADVSSPKPAVSATNPDTIVNAALGQKVMHAWLQNRHQTRFPLVLNLRNNTPHEAGLLQTVVRRAVDLVDPSEAAFDHAAGFMASIGGTLDRAAPPLGSVIEPLREARLTSEAYAACAGALGRRTIAGRRFLDFLAARLGIADEVARSINRRFGA